MKRQLLSLIGISMLLAGPVLAQNFYEKDYAKDPLANRGSQSSLSSELITKTPSSAKDAEDGFSDGTQESSSSSSSENRDEKFGKVQSLGLVVDGTSQVAATAVVSQYIALLNKYEKIKAAKVDFVGREFAMPTQEWTILLNRLLLIGAEINVEMDVSKVPYRNSPTWLIGLEGKTIALEGLQSPEKFITAAGELVLPQFMN